MGFGLAAVAASGVFLQAIGGLKAASDVEDAANANIIASENQREGVTWRKAEDLRDNAREHERTRASINATISASGVSGGTGELFDIEAIQIQELDERAIRAQARFDMEAIDSQTASFKAERSAARGPAKWYNLGGSLLTGGVATATAFNA